MTPLQHEEHLGYARFVDHIEAAEDDIATAARQSALGLPLDCIEHWCAAAEEQLDEADRLLAAEGPRARGAHLAQLYRVSIGHASAAELREQLNAVLYAAVEASSITGGHIEERQA